MVQHVQVGNSTTYLQLNDETNFRLTTVSPEKNQLYSDIEQNGHMSHMLNSSFFLLYSE